MKKILCAFMALILMSVLSVSALAENLVAPLLESAHTLLFDTFNVTLRGKAVFSLNGERFKTAAIRYMQAGEDSFWQLDLQTPRQYRRDQETGFTIIANGEKIYVMERYYPGTYSSGSDQPCNTLIRQSTRADLLFSLLASLADPVEMYLPEGALIASDTDSGREIRISLSEGTTPAILNTSLNLTADFFLRRFMGVNYDSIRGWGQGRPGDYTTVTQAVLYSADSFVLGDPSVIVTEDRAGRLTGIAGSVTALLISEEFARAPLEISFDLAVSDYGATTVKAFNPDDYGVVLKGTETMNSANTDPALSKKLEIRSKELLAAAGYDPSSFLLSGTMREAAGIFYLSFTENGPGSTVTLGLNETGDLLNFTNDTQQYLLSYPHEPKEESLAQETVQLLNDFLQQAFPDLFPVVKESLLGLEYDENGGTLQFVSALDENRSDTGIIFVGRTVPDFQLISYSCLNR